MTRYDLRTIIAKLRLDVKSNRKAQRVCMRRLDLANAVVFQARADGILEAILAVEIAAEGLMES